MRDNICLLSDAQVLDFIVRGYHLVETDLPAAFHEAVCADIAQLPGETGNGILDAVPKLYEVYNHPKVVGALVSLLGEEMEMHGHRHLHTLQPQTLQSQTWHQDSTNVRHHQTWTTLAMYYPQDVTAEMGPTVILPGSHFRNAPTDLMANYCNIRGQVFLTVKAGTVAITHYDLWHAGTLNRSNSPRHMLKFLFSRKCAPTAPSWDHDPIEAEKIAMGHISQMVGPPLGYGSDYYKEWELRMEMWKWMRGMDQTVPAGAMKDMLH